MREVKGYNKRLESLRSIRSSQLSTYRDLADYHLAHRSRFLSSERNREPKRNTKQINNTSRRASRTLAAGMMAGITSPARPWFKLGPSDDNLREDPAVMEWLTEVERMMYAVFAASNVYNSLHTIYADLGVFGIGTLGVYRDFNDVIWTQPYPVGSYMLAADGKNRIDTFYREYETTVGQLVKMFGIDQVSHHVKTAHEKGNFELPVNVVHLIEPNDKRRHGSPLAVDMEYSSVYYEVGKTTESDNNFLRKSGFKRFPLLAPRWEVTGEDIYASDCPGMIALGDTKSLQLGERRMYQALDKIGDPPLQGPISMRSKLGDSIQRGQMIYTDGEGKIESVYGNHRPDLGAIVTVNDRTERRIDEAFYVDLFLMLSQSDRRQITAREVQEKHEEKLLMLGPVLERLQYELLDPLVDVTFDIMQSAGVFPEVPDALADSELSVEYVSILSQAQRLVTTGAVERTIEFAGNVAQIWPEARHKIKITDAIDEYAHAMGTSPKIIRSDREVEGMVAAEQQAAQAAQALETGQQAANVAKTTSEVDVSDDNALAGLMRQL